MDRNKRAKKICERRRAFPSKLTTRRRRATPTAVGKSLRRSDRVSGAKCALAFFDREKNCEGERTFHNDIVVTKFTTFCPILRKKQNVLYRNFQGNADTKGSFQVQISGGRMICIILNNKTASIIIFRTKKVSKILFWQEKTNWILHA